MLPPPPRSCSQCLHRQHVLELAAITAERAEAQLDSGQRCLAATAPWPPSVRCANDQLGKLGIATTVHIMYVSVQNSALLRSVLGLWRV